MNQVAKVTEERQVAARYDEPANQGDGLLGIIERLASNKSMDVAKFEAIVKIRADEQERLRRIEREDREDMARREWLAAFSAVQSEIGPIFRTNENDHTKSKYADLADIERVVTPILTKHGFSTTSAPVPCDLDGHIRMRLTIGHSGGHEKIYEDDFPLDNTGSAGRVNKTAIQAKGSTQTYARRYLKASALDLAFMDDKDGNAVPPEDSTAVDQDQLVKIRKAIADADADVEKFCRFFHIEALPDLPAREFDRAISMIGQRRTRA
ncbi:ERF family protein [Rhizobium bangladeshense]|uniref:ERF family protein n=1 Tax=Rhizobium bangladeshense TaxID=1138189 RepID=UPI001C83E787|nr:ERF family protein [Rhizobium bangladeshense]MBX4889814.1 ERF family protein [Rhizobium bangladeshense]